jgi:two-component system response regulator RegX3
MVTVRDAERGTARIRVTGRTRFERIAGFTALRVGHGVEVPARRADGRWVVLTGSLERPSACHASLMAGRRRILLVDDEPAITEPLSEALEREGFDTHVTASVAGALALAGQHAPDLVLLDLMLPDGSGLEVCRELRQHSSVPIIMLTAKGEEADRVVGLELGADDYVVKPFSARELVARIRAVLRRTHDEAERPPSGPREAGGVRLDPATRLVSREGEPVELTRKEFDVLALLMSQAGAVVTRERLLDEVWDVNWFGSTRTLDVHVSALRRKLADDPAAPRLIHTVRGVGFRFAGPGRP